MSDTKWRRLLIAIAQLNLPVSYWTFRDDPTKEYRRPTPQPDEIINDNAIGDTGVVGPFYLRDVVAVRWPRQIGEARSQPLEEVVDTLDREGAFDTELADDSLTLHAYRAV